MIIKEFEEYIIVDFENKSSGLYRGFYFKWIRNIDGTKSLNPKYNVYKVN